MTNIHRIIANYVKQDFVKGSVTAKPIGSDRVKIIDRTGESMMFSANIHCDIFDCSTKKRIAISDLPHTLDYSPFLEPKSGRIYHNDSKKLVELLRYAVNFILVSFFISK